MMATVIDWFARALLVAGGAMCLWGGLSLRKIVRRIERDHDAAVRRMDAADAQLRALREQRLRARAPEATDHTGGG